MAEERVITINLRKDLIKVPRWKRSKIAAKILREKLKKAAKTNKIKIDSSVNKKIWQRGIERPTMKLKVKIIKIDENTSKIELM